MHRSLTNRTSQEPIDRRQIRLIHALLAFPVAGVIGFTGNAVVAHVLSESPAIVAPASPERTTDEHTSPHEPVDGPDASDRASEPTAL
jgi:hypothetical protein